MLKFCFVDVFLRKFHKDYHNYNIFQHNKSVKYEMSASNMETTRNFKGGNVFGAFISKVYSKFVIFCKFPSERLCQGRSHFEISKSFIFKSIFIEECWKILWNFRVLSSNWEKNLSHLIWVLYKQHALDEEGGRIFHNVSFNQSSV